MSAGLVAAQNGAQMIVMHGRSRACKFRGTADYTAVAELVGELGAGMQIPVLVNGDIDSVAMASQALQQSGADGVMIGRAAQGSPWIFREILHYRETGQHLPAPSPAEIRAILTGHLKNLYAFYGEYTGVRVARKHIAWYSKGQRDGNAFRQQINQVESATAQLARVHAFFEQLAEQQDLAA